MFIKNIQIVEIVRSIIKVKKFVNKYIKGIISDEI